MSYICSIFRRFRRYRSATIYISQPVTEDLKNVFFKEIGEENRKYIIHIKEIPCSVIPFQSAAFLLKHGNGKSFIQESEWKSTSKDIGKHRLHTRNTEIAKKARINSTRGTRA